MKDKIGNVVRALVAVPIEYLGILLDLAIKLGGVDGNLWYRRLVEVSKETIVTTISVVNMLNVQEYFINRPGLCVWSNFVSWIFPAYVAPIARRGLEGVDYVDLLKNMFDREILAEHLGGEDEARKHAFTPDQIAELIENQKNGQTGALLNNGYANIFYVLGKGGVLFAVVVLWYSDGRRWSVRAYELGEGGYWSAGSRIFRNKL